MSNGVSILVVSTDVGVRSVVLNVVVGLILVEERVVVVEGVPMCTVVSLNVVWLCVLML